MKVSAKTGLNVKLLLDEVVRRVPSPNLVETGVFKGSNVLNILGFLIDSWFIKDKGVVLLVQVKAGTINKGDSIVSCGFG